MNDSKNEEGFAELLARHAERLGLSLGSELARVVGYLAILRKWNARINLVGTQDARTIVVQHVVDSLAVLPHIPIGTRRVVDVGSGAGLPGAVIAAVRRDVAVTALEPIHKKHAFLAAVRRELGLDNFHPLAERMEVFQARKEFEPFDVATSRATFALPDWLERARSLVRGGGRILGMEGLEQHELPSGAVRHGYELDGRTRSVVVLRT